MPALCAIAIAACDEGPSTSTNASSDTRELTAVKWLSAESHGIGNIGCDGQLVAWTTSSQPLTKSNTRNDLIVAADQLAGRPKQVAAALHGGDLTDKIAMTQSWVVYLEYQQHALSSVNFWYLIAVDTRSGATIQLASATQGLGLNELPWYDAAGGIVVWNQTDESGHEMIHLHDLGRGTTSTLQLPTSVSPFEPSISGHYVVFVDNGVDPQREHEDFLGRRGSLIRYDLDSGRVSTISASPTAWMPELRGSEVTWTDMSGLNSRVEAASVLGGPVSTFGSDPFTPQTNGTTVVWFDSGAMTFATYELTSGHETRLDLIGLSNPRSVFELCGNRVFFALPQAVDAGTSNLRYFDL